MKTNIKQKFFNFTDEVRSIFNKKQEVETPAPLNIVPQATLIQIIEACTIFINKNEKNLDFIAGSSMNVGYDDVTIYVVNKKENSKYNQISFFTNQKVVSGYYFKLTMEKINSDNSYVLEFISGESFDFFKEYSNPEIYKKIGKLFELLCKKYNITESIKKTNKTKQVMNQMLTNTPKGI